MARTIAVLGASNTGKSTLVDRMCALEGQPHPPAAPGELRVVTFTHLDETWQAIDTPGSIELLHVATDALLAADAAVICVGPDPAAALLASPYLHAAEAAGTPAILFINRIDEATGRVRDIVAALQDYAQHPIVLRQIPIRDGGQVTGAVDLVSERAWAYREGEPSTAHRDPCRHARPRARGPRRAARAPLGVRRPPARRADRGPRAAERRGLCPLRQGPEREPGDRGADRLCRARQRHRPGDEGAPPRGPGARGPARAAAGAGRAGRAADRRRLRQRLPQAPGQDPAAPGAGAARLRPAAGRPPRRPAHPRRPARQPPPRRGARRGDRERGQGRPPRLRPARHSRRAARDAPLAPPAAAGRLPHPRPHLGARRRQALRRAGLARRERQRARGQPGSRHRRGAGRHPGAAAPPHGAPAPQGRLRHGGGGGDARPRLPRDHRPHPGNRLPPQEADRRRRPVRRRAAGGGARRPRRRLRLLRGGQGRRRAAQLHPRRRAGRARRHGARPARLSRCSTWR